MSIVSVAANDVDSGLELQPPITLNGAPRGTAPTNLDVTAGNYQVGFGQIAGYTCLSPSVAVNVGNDAAMAVAGQYRKT